VVFGHIKLDWELPPIFQKPMGRVAYKCNYNKEENFTPPWSFQDLVVEQQNQQGRIPR